MKLGWTIAPRRSLAAMTLVALFAVLPDSGRAGEGAGTLRALVVGIDAYEFHVRRGDDPAVLDGAIHDAEDIADALGALENVDVTILRDTNYSEFTAALESSAEGMSASDVLLVTFSGHGIRLTGDGWIQDEADGADEAILFAPFRSGDPNRNGQYFPDDFFANFLQNVPGLTILVMDACHSGTMLSGPRPENSVLFAAVPEDEVSKEVEVTIEGKAQARGALSLAFARGLRGEADQAPAGDGDGRIDIDEMIAFVQAVVPELTDGDAPQITRGDAAGGVFARLRRDGTAATPP